MVMKEALMLSFGLALMASLSMFFDIQIGVDAGFRKVADPSYPMLHAVAMQEVDGEPFMHYLSLALEGEEVVEGVNVTKELMKFNEPFTLENATGAVILRTGKLVGSKAYLAVPPGGVLVVSYDG